MLLFRNTILLQEIQTASFSRLSNIRILSKKRFIISMIPNELSGVQSISILQHKFKKYTLKKDCTHLQERSSYGRL